MNPTLQTLLAHRTVRHFSPHALSNEEIDLIAAAAQRAPSWMNGQHYTIIRISDPNLRAQIAAVQPNNPQIAQCSEFWIFVGDAHKAELCSRHHNAPFNSVASSETLITLTTDAALAAQNAATAAESLGYATCFIGGIRTIAAELVEWLALPQHTFPLFGLCIGRAAVEMRLKPRLPQHTVLANNRYPSDEQLTTDLADYEQVMTEFAEAREKLPYREKFARFYTQAYAPRTPEVLRHQGLRTPNNDE